MRAPAAKPHDGATEALVGIGSNIQPLANVEKAFVAMREAGILVSSSRLWSTPPVGTAGPPFVNAAAIVQFPHCIEPLQGWLRSLEERLGRVRTQDKYAPRTIDLDLLAIRDGAWLTVETRLGEQPFHWSAIAELVPGLLLSTDETVAEALAARPLQDAVPLERAQRDSTVRPWRVGRIPR